MGDYEKQLDYLEKILKIYEPEIDVSKSDPSYPVFLEMEYESRIRNAKRSYYPGFGCLGDPNFSYLSDSIENIKEMVKITEPGKRRKKGIIRQCTDLERKIEKASDAYETHRRVQAQRIHSITGNYHICRARGYIQ